MQASIEGVLMRARLTYANVISTLALFLALGGVSWAAIELPARSVGTRELKNNAVKSSKIANGAVQRADIADDVLPARGPAGERGPAGPRGATGAQGPAGAQGPPACDQTRLLLCSNADLPAGDVLELETAGVTLTTRTARMDCVGTSPCTLSFVGTARVPDAVHAWYQLARVGSPLAFRDTTLTVRRNGAVAYRYLAVNAIPTAILVQAGRYQLNLDADELLLEP
jgi:hypothetical protein